MEYVFIFREDTTHAEWGILLSKCTLGVVLNPTTIRYSRDTNLFKFSNSYFEETTYWVRAKSYEEFMTLLLEIQLER